MYIKLSQPEIQDNTSPAKPDLAMMLRAYELFFAGVREEEVVGFGQHYAGDNFKYVSYLTFKENLDELVEWQASSRLSNVCFLANPLHDNFNQPEKDRTYKKTEPGTTTSAKSTEADFVRVCWYLLDLDRVKALKKPEGSKGDSPATPEQLTMLAKANKALMDFLEGIGFSCILNHFSGNGYGLAIPVLFANNRETKRKFESMNKIIQESLKDFPEVEIDNSFASPRQPWSIPGSLNRKAGRQTLRRALNYDQFTPEDIVNSRDSNSMCLEAHLAEAKILTASDYQPKGRLVYNEAISGFQSEMADYLTQWDNDHCFKEMLIDHGYKLVKDFGYRALLKRPDKEGPGHGLVVGGQKNRLWNWSSSDPYFPQNQLIKPYWAYLLLKGIAKDNRIVDQLGAKDFYREVARKYKLKLPFSLDRQIHLGNQVEVPRRISAPAIVEPAKPVEPIEPAKPIEQSRSAQDSRQATGTLGDTPMPGVIEQIAQDIGVRNPMVSPAIDRAMALAKFQFLMGKSRVHESGTYANSWIVNLAPSSAGKEAGKNYIQRFMNQVAENFESSKLMPSLPSHCFGYKIVGVNGSNGGSSQGIQDELLVNGRVLIIGDESERFLHPTSKNERAIEIRDMLLGVSSRGLLIGRALSQTHTRHTVTNCFVSQIHITQPKPYFEAFTNDNDLKGSIGRYLHFEAPKGLPRFGNVDLGINQELIEQGLYWQGENLKGLERSLDKLSGTMGKENLYFLGKFKPDQIVMRYSQSIDGEQGRVHQYRIYCNEQAKKQGLQGNGLLERFWDKAAENALRLAMTYSAAVDREARTISSEAWDLATTHLEGSMKTLIANRNDILKSKGEAREEAMMAYLKDFWSRGELITQKTLYDKFRGQYRNGEASGKQDFDQDLALLISFGKIQLVKLNTPGVPSFQIIPFTPPQEPSI